jgi:hypothetical protein
VFAGGAEVDEFGFDLVGDPRQVGQQCAQWRAEEIEAQSGGGQHRQNQSDRRQKFGNMAPCKIANDRSQDEREYEREQDRDDERARVFKCGNKSNQKESDDRPAILDGPLHQVAFRPIHYGLTSRIVLAASNL